MRRAKGMLLLSLLCMLGACGPGVNGELEPGEVAGRPVLGKLESEVVDVECTALRLRLHGSGFTFTSRVYWRERPLDTTFVSDTELSAVLPLGDSISWSEADLSVRDLKQPWRFSEFRRAVPYPTPVLTGIEPGVVSSALQGPVRVRLTGRNFVTGSQVDYRGTRYPADVITPRYAEVVLPADALQASGPDGQVQLGVPRPLARSTGALTLKVERPIAQIEGVWPGALSTGGDASSIHNFLVISVSNFQPGVMLLWNGVPVESFVYEGFRELYVRLPEWARSHAGNVSLTLETFGKGVSEPFLFPVEDAPVVHRVSQSIRVGSRSVGFQGEGFGDEVEVYLGDERLEPFYSQYRDSVSATLPAEATSQPGMLSLRLRRKADGAFSAPMSVAVVEEAPAPLAYGLEPAVVTAGDTPVQLTVHGSAFEPGSVIRIDGEDRPSHPNGAYVITTTLKASDLAQEGVRTVTVHTPGPGGGTTLPLLLKVEARRPVPQLSNLSPPFATAGRGPLTLYLSGEGLGSYTVVQWNGGFITTRWEPTGNGTEHRLAVDVPAEKLARPGVARLEAFNATPSGGLSNALDFAILEPGTWAPALSPRTLESGSPDLTLTLEGSGFTEDTFIMVGDVSRTPTFVSDTKVSLTLLAQDVAQTGTLALRTVTPRTEGSEASASQFLHVVPPRTPVLRTLIPAVWSVGALVAGESHSLVVHGLHLTPGGTVTQETSTQATLDWGGAAHPLGYIDWSNLGIHGLGLGADFAGSGVTAPGVMEVSVSRAGEGGGTSLPALVHVVAERPVPFAREAEPPVLRSGAASQVLLVRGEGFHPQSVVRWNGEALVTWMDGPVLRAKVPGTLLASPGGVRLTVETPAPGGGVSVPIAISVQ